MDATSPSLSIRLRLVAGLVALAMTPILGIDPAKAEKRLYRWVDESGVVHYSDQIPPAQVDRGRTELNEQGIAVQTVPPAQTAEDIQREQVIERLRAQRERLMAEQKAADRVLLRTFRSVDEIAMARDGRLAAIDAAIQVARGNAHRQQDWLKNLRSQAADFERTGKPVPPHTLDGIAKAERNIRDAYAAILKQEQDKSELRMDFDRDLKRFRQLKNIPEEATDAPTEIVRPVLRNLVICQDKAQCDLYWGRAEAYIEANAAAPVQIVGDYVLMAPASGSPDEVSLTLSRIEEQGRPSASLFLDIQCKSQVPGGTGCNTGRAAEILDGYRQAVENPPASPAGTAPEPSR